MAPGDNLFVVTLLHPDEYAKHLNEVAGLSTRDITFLKRKFVSKAGWELMNYPLAECASISYKDERPIASVLLGILLVTVVSIAGYGLIAYWDGLTPGTRVPIGALALGAVYGVRFSFLSRRHRLIFSMQDGSQLIWKTTAGDYKYQQSRADRVVEFAKSRGLLRDAG